MATKKRYSDINKAIKEAEARREEYYKQVGRVTVSYTHLTLPTKA